MKSLGLIRPKGAGSTRSTRTGEARSTGQSDWRRLVLISLLSLLSSGCAFNQKLTYEMDDIQPERTSRLSDYVLDIQKFKDVRESINENRILFSQPRQTKADGVSSCINSEEHYEKGTVATQISTTISDHLRKKGIFKSVTVDKREAADFYLTGTIRRLYSQQEFSTSAVVGSQFGLIGALLTMNATTPGSIEIEFSDLQIFDKGGKLVGTLGPLRESFKGDLPVDAHCWSAYWNVNAKLKIAVDRLADRIRSIPLRR